MPEKVRYLISMCCKDGDRDGESRLFALFRIFTVIRFPNAFDHPVSIVAMDQECLKREEDAVVSVQFRRNEIWQ
jgi:hypothetical protein